MSLVVMLVRLTQRNKDKPAQRKGDTLTKYTKREMMGRKQSRR